MRLAGNVAMITGAAQGIGKAYAERFSAEGAYVAIVDTREIEAHEAAAELSSAHHRVIALEADITDAKAMDRAVQSTIDEFGRIDTLVNNAALYSGLEFRNQSVEYLAEVLRINVIGTLVASRAVFPPMKQQLGGSIINIGSTAAYEYVTSDGLERDHETIPSFQYALSKATVIDLTKLMAGAIGKYHIRVNCLCPGMTLSRGTLQALPPELITERANATAMQRSLEPSDLAGTAVYLASDESAMVTGQLIVVDGGLVMPG